MLQKCLFKTLKGWRNIQKPGALWFTHPLGKAPHPMIGLKMYSTTWRHCTVAIPWPSNWWKLYNYLPPWNTSSPLIASLATHWCRGNGLVKNAQVLKKIDGRRATLITTKRFEGQVFSERTHLLQELLILLVWFEARKAWPLLCRLKNQIFYSGRIGTEFMEVKTASFFVKGSCNFSPG